MQKSGTVFENAGERPEFLARFFCLNFLPEFLPEFLPKQQRMPAIANYALQRSCKAVKHYLGHGEESNPRCSVPEANAKTSIPHNLGLLKYAFKYFQ
jgi:hypothetical protein